MGSFFALFSVLFIFFRGRGGNVVSGGRRKEVGSGDPISFFQSGGGRGKKEKTFSLIGGGRSAVHSNPTKNFLSLQVIYTVVRKKIKKNWETLLF